MKIAFLNPPAADVRWFGDKANFEAPLGIAVLAAYLRERGHEPCIVDVAAERLSDAEVCARLAGFGPALVGITAATVVMPNATRLADAVRRHLPDAVVVLGGKHVTAIPEDVHATRPRSTSRCSARARRRCSRSSRRSRRPDRERRFSPTVSAPRSPGSPSRATVPW